MRDKLAPTLRSTNTAQFLKLGRCAGGLRSATPPCISRGVEEAVGNRVGAHEAPTHGAARATYLSLSIKPAWLDWLPQIIAARHPFVCRHSVQS